LELASASKKSNAVEKAEKLLTPSEALSKLQSEDIEKATTQSVAFEQLRYGFVLGAIGVLTPADMISEVLDIQRIYTLPNTANWMQGLINLRGNLVPVFDLSKLLNITDNTKTQDDTQIQQNMLIIGSGKQAFALIIDGLPQPITAERIETELPPIADYAKSFVFKSYSFQHRIWIDLDLENYLLSLRNQLAAA
jgi:chemotaxis signal transduction protein